MERDTKNDFTMTRSKPSGLQRYDISDDKISLETRKKNLRSQTSKAEQVFPDTVGTE